jgi:hypothetical protein
MTPNIICANYKVAREIAANVSQLIETLNPNKRQNRVELANKFF